MIRLILFLLAVAVLAAGFAWVADRPGDVVITWIIAPSPWPERARRIGGV